MSMKFLLQFIMIVMFFSCADAQNNYNHAVVDQIRTAVKDLNSEFNHLSYNRLAYIVDSYGPRLWGSPSQALALDDLYQQMKTMGFDNVVKEQLDSFMTWKRGKESVTLYDPRPFPQKLAMIGLGLSAPGNVTAYVVVVRTFDELDTLGTVGVQGKIVCFNQAWTQYNESVLCRARGAIQASKYGAVGVLVRSVASVSINSPHTVQNIYKLKGQVEYDENYKQIPAAAISVEDAQMLQRMQDRGSLIKVHLEMESEWYNSTSHNLIAEIKGAVYPEEILLLGGHLDSWDTGSQTGANDDGGGVMVCLEALHVLSALGIKPKRTIRFIAWSGEEFGILGNGADQYLVQHANELSKHILAFESDDGTTKPYGFGFNGGPLATKIIVDLATQYLLPINSSKIIPGDGLMFDTQPLGLLGIPLMRNEVDDTVDKAYYFSYHHSSGDTMDVMSPEDMDDNVVAIASMFFLVADSEQSLPRN